jgi:hypothetical protein
MEVSDQFKAPAVFPSRNKPRYSHSIGLGPQTGLDVVAANKKKNLSASGIELRT